MDRGGVWNGSAEVTAVTGDTFQVTVCNTAPAAADTAYSLTGSVALSAGFSYVPNTATGIPGVTASQAGQTLTFAFPANTDLSTGTCVTERFGLTAAASVGAGTYPLTYTIGYGTTPGGTDGSLPVLQNVLVQSGAATIVKGPADQLAPVGSTVTWSVTVTNTGSGGMFGVAIDESAINPAASVSFTTMTQTAPASPQSTASAASRTLAYLAPGQVFTSAVSAVITGCLNLNNTATVDDRTHASAGSASTQVLLDFRTPLVDFTAPPIVLNNLAPTSVSIPINNTGHGDARAAVLATTLGAFPVAVSGVSAGWAYDAASGSFTKTANGGTIGNMTSETLSFTIQPSGGGVCVPPAAALYFVTGHYADVCGNPYVNPVRFAGVSASYTQPALSLALAQPSGIVAPATAVVSTVSISITRPDLIGSNPIVVIDTLPANVTNLALGSVSGGQTAACPGGVCHPGDAVTWTIPNPGGVSTLNYQLPVTFNVPVVTCADNQFASFASTTAAVDAAGCPVSASAAGSSVLTNIVTGGSSAGYSQAYTIAGGVHEAGFPDDGNGTRDAGEGEFIAFTATYTFPSGFAGTWAGSFYRDDFGGVSTMTLVPGSLKVSWDGGAPVAVPGASVQQALGSLRFTADFLAGAAFLNSPGVAGHSVKFVYSATVPDDALNAQGALTISHFSDFEVAGAAGACNTGPTTRIIQFGAETVKRAVETLSVAMPSVVDVCQTFTATATLTGANFSSYLTSATALTNSSYTYLAPQTPTYTPLFTSGNVAYAENGGVNPQFPYTGGSFLGSGAFGVQLRRRALAGTNNAAVNVTASYDDWQRDPGFPPFTLASGAAPQLTQQGRLALTATPQSVSVTGNQVTWVVYANNTGSGQIYGLSLKDVIPAGLTINVSSTNAQNPNYPISVSGTTITWNQLIGGGAINIPAGGGIALTVVADVAGGVCSIPTGTAAIDGRWGCDGLNAEDVLNSNPNFSFPSGGLQAVHDSVNTFTRLCSADYDVMIARNTGLTHVYGVQMQEVLNPSATGVDIVTGSVQVSTDNGATWTSLGAGGDPTGTGTTADPYTWTSAQVPALADVPPFGAGAYSAVRLRVQVTASEQTNGLLPSVTTKASGHTACGQVLTDPGTPFTLLVRKPNLTVTKVGRNLAGGGNAAIVYGGQGDTIVWTVTAQNNGQEPANHLRLLDLLASDGGAATVSGAGITGAPPLTSGSAVAVSTLAALGSAVYTVTETLGASCVADVNTANFSWGCAEQPAGRISSLNTPTTSTATAQIVMTPTFAGGASALTFTPLGGGRTEVVAHFVDNGGTALGLVIVSTVSAGQIMDATSTPTFTTDGAVSAMTAAGPLTSPHFSFTGSLRHGNFLELRYRLIQTGNFDVATSSFNYPDSVGAGTDPAPPAAGSVSAEIDFSNTCSGSSSSTLSAVLTPFAPNVNITSLTPAQETILAGVAQNFDFTLTNQGAAGSLADHLAFTLPEVGGGWTVNSVTVVTPGAGGTGGLCAANACAEAQLGTLSLNQAALVRVNATPSDNGSPLNLDGLVVGTIHADDGTDTGHAYTYDAAAVRVVGVSVLKSLVATSESFTSTGTLAIGEDATFQLDAHWFGGTTISTITVRDTLPAGLGFVSFSTAAGHDLPVPTATGASFGAGGAVDFKVSDFSGQGSFRVLLNARALNQAGNTNGKLLTNNLGVQFDAIGRTFASNSAADGFAGGAEALLHSSTTTTIARPVLSIVKQVEDVTAGGSYAASARAAGGDTLQYRVTVANGGSAPAFDTIIYDALATSKLLMVDGSAGGGAFVAGANGSVTYNNANDPGQKLDELDPGQSAVVVYQAQVDQTASPNDTLFNGASYYAYSLPGTSGHEGSPAGVEGSPTGRGAFQGGASAPVTVSSITFGKALTLTAVPGVSTSVVIGEQVQFTLSLVMPPGTTPGLKVFDTLPAGLRLIQTPAVTLGSAISPVAPSITPAVPANGPVVTWDFGTVTVASNTTPAARTITIPYVTQVRNAAGIVDGSALVNSSSYTYTGLPPVNASAVTLTVKEPNGPVTATISPAAGVAAGSVVVATITVTNSGHSAARDLNLAITLPPGLSYVGASTLGLGGPAIGEPDVSGSTLTYGRAQGAPQVIDVSTATPLKFQLQLLLGPGVRPGQPLGYTATADWTSLPGAPGPDLSSVGAPAVGSPGAADGERTGTGGVNSYHSVNSATTTVSNLFSISKSSAAGPLPDGSYRVGDLVAYTLKGTFQGGTTANTRFVDALPAGLAFDSEDPITPSSGTAGVAFTEPAASSAPAPGALGPLNWFLGTVTNDGPAPVTLTLVYRARVLNAGGLATSPSRQKPVNNAQLKYENFNAVGQATLVSGSTISVEQPLLSLSKTLRVGQSTSAAAGAPVHYSVTVANSGAGAAYGITVQDTLPVGLQTATPSVSSATLNGLGVTLSQSYTAGTGVLQWTLDDTQVLNGSVSGSTMTLKIDYDATVDAGLGAGATLTNSALVTQYFSQPTTNPVERRQYAATASSQATVTTPLPSGIAKAVSLSSAAIGASPAYTITVPTGPVSAALYNVRVQDVIPAGLTLASHGNNAALLAAGGCGTINVVDNSAGNTLDLTYSCLPPNARAVVSATTTVANAGGNLLGTTLSNGASFTWTKTPAGAVQPAISTAGIVTTVVEPRLAVTKTLVSVTTASASMGLQAGDKARYRIKIVAAGGANNSPAYNLAIRDLSDPSLLTPNTLANPDNPGAPANEGLVNGSNSYRWDVPGPLLPGATYQFDVELTLGPGVQPLQTLLNTSSVTWTSLPAPGGAGVGQRDGSGGINNYAAAAPSPAAIVIGSAHVEKAIKAPGGSNYAVGADVVYRLDFTFNQGAVDALHMLDALPAGLVYSTASVSASNAQAAGGGAVAIAAGPAPGALGGLDFTLGNLQSSGSSPTVHLDLTARVRDLGGNLNGTSLTNGVSAQLVSSTGGVVAIGPMNALPQITVVEPKLVLAHDGPAGDTMDLGSTVTFTVRAKNFGTSEAFQPTLQVQLAAGMRAASPAARPTTLLISGGRALALTAGTDYTVAYSSTTGLLSVVFASSSAYIAAGEAAALTYQALADNNAPNAQILDSTAAVTQYYSHDTSAGVGADTRLYANSLAASAGHLADGAAQQVTDSFGDDAPVTIRAPVLSLTKSVTPFSATLPADTVLTWSVAIANGGAIASAGGAFADDLGAFAPASQYISSGSLTGVSVSGAAGFADGSNANGGTSGKGAVSITNLSIPALSTVTVSFSVHISSQIPNATKIQNRAAFTVPGFNTPFLSVSNRGVDGSTTTATINSTPGFRFDKSAAVVGGGSLVAGSTIAYSFIIRNQGTERSTNTVVVDGIPSNTSYVPNSTTLNGVAAADVNGASPLISGLSVNSPSSGAGILEVYNGSGEATVGFRVRLATGVPSGSAISNQAVLNGSGEGTGTPIVRLSDDPSTVPSPDPTVLVVSGGPFLVSEKTSSIDVGPALLPSGTLTYSIAVRNLGDLPAASVVLKDPLPANSSYVAGSLLFGVGASTPVAMSALTDAADGDSGDFNATASSAVTVNIGTITAHGLASVSFRIKVASAPPTGTLIANQATITGKGLPTVLSDGDGNHGNGDQPTYNVVGATGTVILKQTKVVSAVNGGVVGPGDLLEYQITTFNVGNATATNVTILDAVPGAHAVYSTGTTTVDGVPLADAGLISPLVAGANVGSLNPGQSRLVRFRVRVSSTAAAGDSVDDQASFTATGGITGTSCSDRPDCVTRVQVGGTPGSATLSGRVWIDLLHTRAFDPGDPAQPGWLLEVVRGGVVVASQRTAADGTYRIPNLPPGAGYQVRFREPTSNVVFGKAQSTVAGADLTDGTIRNLTLSDGDNVLNQNLPLDPSGVLYDAVTRQPVAGVQVFLDGPAGFDPVLHLLPGQQGQVTAANGLYRFDINFGAGAPVGAGAVYSLRFAAPNGYLTTLPGTPSTIVPPPASTAGCAAVNCLDVPAGPPDPFLVQAQNTAPTGVQPTTYYTRYQFTALGLAAVVNDHVPLDPILSNAIFVTKTVRVVDVSRGDLVAYTITARNMLSSTLTNISLLDLMPPGFKYRSGSASLNGKASEPAAAARQLSWPNLTFAPNETKTINLLLIVGSGVGFGQYVNQAWALNALVGAKVSNTAAVTVRVTPDPTFDCTDILGKVFDDANANGYQDEGERGLPNVRLVTARGWLIDTDAQGRFHIACADAPNEARGSNFVMKLDERTLPTGYRATTENPRAIRLTAGKAARIEFGAALYQVVRLDLSLPAFKRPEPPTEAPPRPAPAPRQAWELVVDTQTIPPIYFRVGKFELDPERAADIRAAMDRAAGMTGVREVKLKVVGHTDSSPITGTLKASVGDNWALSRSRAATLAGELRQRLRLSSGAVLMDGKADTEPAASNATPEGRALNRRAEIELVYERAVRRDDASQAPAVSTAAATAAAAAAAAPPERAPWHHAVDRLLEALERRPSALRLGYCRAPGEKVESARFRLWEVSEEVRRRWTSVPGRYALIIEQELDGTACAGDKP